MRNNQSAMADGVDKDKEGTETLLDDDFLKRSLEELWKNPKSKEFLTESISGEAEEDYEKLSCILIAIHDGRVDSFFIPISNEAKKSSRNSLLKLQELVRALPNPRRLPLIQEGLKKRFLQEIQDKGMQTVAALTLVKDQDGKEFGILSYQRFSRMGDQGDANMFGYNQCLDLIKGFNFPSALN